MTASLTSYPSPFRARLWWLDKMTISDSRSFSRSTTKDGATKARIATETMALRGLRLKPEPFKGSINSPSLVAWPGNGREHRLLDTEGSRVNHSPSLSQLDNALPQDFPRMVSAVSAWGDFWKWRREAAWMTWTLALASGTKCKGNGKERTEQSR